MEYVPCIGNSSYSFWRILLKLYRCFKDGLKICILFFQNPEIIFYHFLRIFNLNIFRALILQICIWSIYLVSATPPTVFGESFWNFTVVFRMVWRYAYCFLRILKLFFLHFNLDIFSSLYATDMYREYMPCIGNPAYSFRPILLKLYRYFAAFLWFHMRNLSLAGYRGAWWLSGRVSDSGARGPGFETYRRRVVSLSKTLYSPKVLVNYPGSDGSVPTWLKNCWLGR